MSRDMSITLGGHKVYGNEVTVYWEDDMRNLAMCQHKLGLKTHTIVLNNVAAALDVAEALKEVAQHARKMLAERGAR